MKSFYVMTNWNRSLYDMYYKDHLCWYVKNSIIHMIRKSQVLGKKYVRISPQPDEPEN